MLAILIHVGQTPNVNGGKCPVFSDGTFRFVPIVVESPRSDPDPSFAKLGLGDFVPPAFRNEPAFQSPEFQTLTYSHIARGGESDVYERLRNEGGFLVFFSTLYYCDETPPIIDGISSDRGAYIIGYFNVEGVYTDREVVADSRLQTRFRANGQFGRKNEIGERRGADLWISGSEGRLFPKATPLTEASDRSRWNAFARNNLTTTKGKSLSNYSRAFYNWTLVCPSKNVAVLRSWIHQFTEVRI